MQPKLKTLSMAESQFMNRRIEEKVENWLRIRRPNLVPILKNKSYEFINIVKDDINKIKNFDNRYLNYVRKWIEKEHPRLLAEFRLFFDFG